MRKIKIVGVPPGFAPEEIRRQWVGIEIPLLEAGENLSKEGWVGTGNEGGYVVSGGDAITALRKAKKHEAATFWEGIVPAALRFNKQICELIE